MGNGSRGGSAVRIALALLVALLLYLGLTPLDFSPENGVAWEPERAGLRFDGKGIALHADPLGWRAAPKPAITLLIEATPSSASSSGLGTLLSFEDGSRPQPLLVAQWKSYLVLRVRALASADPGRGYWEIGASDALLVDQPSSIVIRSSPERGTIIHVAGKEAVRSNRSILPPNAEFGGRLIVGSMGDGRAGWAGLMTGLAIYDEWLSDADLETESAQIRRSGFAALERRESLLALHAFEDDPGDVAANLASTGPERALLIPTAFEPPAPNAFSLPLRTEYGKRWFLRDIAINMVGFLPFGLLLVLLLLDIPMSGTRALVGATFCGILLSLGIESIQILIPVRNSSLTDLALNVLGTGLGAAVGIVLRRSGWLGPGGGDLDTRERDEF